MYLVSGSLSGIWLNTQQVQGLGLAWSWSGSSSNSGDSGSDEDSSDEEDSSSDKGVECSEKEPWEDIVV